MAAEPRKVRVRWWAQQAGFWCGQACGELADVAALLESPAHFADAQDQLKSLLWNASSSLVLAAQEMAVCEMLALRAGAADPSRPPRSIHGLPDGHHSVRLALGMLQSAGACAEDARGSVERCHDHVNLAYHLMGHPGLPGLYGIAEAERVAALGLVEVARGLAASSADLAAAAVPLVI